MCLRLYMHALNMHFQIEKKVRTCLSFLCMRLGVFLCVSQGIKGRWVKWQKVKDILISMADVS